VDEKYNFELEFENNHITMRLNSELVSGIIDSSLTPPFTIIRKGSNYQLSQESRELVRQASVYFQDNRNRAGYGEELFTSQDAQEAIAKMKHIFEAAEELLVVVKQEQDS
jgi:hypothetical protein